MRKSHLILVIIAAVMALFSAYSLAAINQVYKVNFEWYSQYYSKYTGEYRETLKDKWLLQAYPEHMEAGVVVDGKGLALLKKREGTAELKIAGVDFDKYILLYYTLGKVYSPEYRAKIIDIAQRGTVVEIKVSMNSPAKSDEKSIGTGYGYLTADVVRIDRRAFPIRGRLCFIFKNQDGTPLYEKYCDVK